MNLLTFLLVIVYGIGVWKFWTGFERTNFVKSFGNRVWFSLMWPVMLVSKSYRQNFSKALKGSRR
ncbi:MAG: hypothetical protein ACFBSC_18635 [Microcoleaceae cyanobacterium]